MFIYRLLLFSFTFYFCFHLLFFLLFNNKFLFSLLLSFWSNFGCFIYIWAGMWMCRPFSGFLFLGIWLRLKNYNFYEGTFPLSFQTSQPIWQNPPRISRLSGRRKKQRIFQKNQILYLNFGISNNVCLKIWGKILQKQKFPDAVRDFNVSFWQFQFETLVLTRERKGNSFWRATDIRKVRQTVCYLETFLFSYTKYISRIMQFTDAK